MNQIQLLKQVHTNQPVYNHQLESPSPLNYSYSKSNQQHRRPMQYYKKYSIPMAKVQPFQHHHQPKTEVQPIQQHHQPITEIQPLQHHHQQHQLNQQEPIQQHRNIFHSRNENLYQQQSLNEVAMNRPKKLRYTMPFQCEVMRPMTSDVWTQTRSSKAIEMSLLKKIKVLEEKLKSQNLLIQRLQHEKLRTPSPHHDISNSTTSSTPRTRQEEARYRLMIHLNECVNEGQVELDLNDGDGLEDLPIVNNSTDSDENKYKLITENVLVSIGPNGTKIPAIVYDEMSWESASLSTRKLLNTIFDRETLATHTMTGKPAPSFKDLDKPIKGKLDSNAVDDIVFAVSKKCQVSIRKVRSAITTKCADENKLSRLKAMKNFEIEYFNSKRSALSDDDDSDSN